ncbi:MAG: sugar transferase, partial [Anaerolineales bacterium]|nr:sugar transferase [Anaerolineales bacterium]
MTDTISFQTAIRSRTPSNPIGEAAKRIFDFCFALLGLIILSPFFGLLVLLILRDTPGPAFFRGPRVGRGGKTFQILKFRTMFERPETYDGPKVTTQGDPRITPVGRWLRNTKLNELPQLWNVLKGEMSLVGPRPEDPDIAVGWPAEVKDEIFSVRPGITSPASVLYRNEESLLPSSGLMRAYWDTVLPSKMRLDQLYVRNRSFWLDLDVLFWTGVLILLRLGSYQPPEQMLFLGPISRFASRHFNWFVVDVLFTFTAIGLTGLVWRSFGPLDVGWLNSLLFALGFALLFSLTGAVFGVHRVHWSRARAEDAFDLLMAALAATLVAFIVDWGWPPSPLFPPAMILVASGVAFAGFVLVRYRRRILRGAADHWGMRSRRAAATGERVLIVGGGETGQFVASMLSRQRTAGAFHLVGFIDDDLYKQGSRIRGIQVIGQRSDIPEIVKTRDVGILVFAIHNISRKERGQLLNICAGTTAQLVMAPDIIGALSAIASLSRESNHRPPVKRAAPTYEVEELPGAGIPPDQVDAWLMQINKFVEAGELERAQAQIRTLRTLLHYAPRPVEIIRS